MKTLKQTKGQANRLGYSVTKKHGEFRLAPLGVLPRLAEDRAYYTDCIKDVRDTLAHLAKLEKNSYRIYT